MSRADRVGPWPSAPPDPSPTRGSCGRSRTPCATGSSASSPPPGPSRAADLAHDLGIPANQASFHLRQLAKYGLVEEAPELARDRRDRVWRAVHEEGVTVETSLHGGVGRRRGGRARLPPDPLGLGARRGRRGVLDREDPRHPAHHRRLPDQADQGRGPASSPPSSTPSCRPGRDRTRGRDSSRRTYVLLSMLQPETALTTHPETRRRPVVPDDRGPPTDEYEGHDRRGLPRGPRLAP